LAGFAKVDSLLVSSLTIGYEVEEEEGMHHRLKPAVPAIQFTE